MIYVVRNQQVMIDRDLAILYQVETKRLNEAVKKNIARFPERFRFQLAKEEYENLKSQFVISSLEEDNGYGGRRKLPFIFTEQGIAMLSAVLRSDVAVTIYTQKWTKLMKADVENFNVQYPTLKIKYTKVFHDRFLILDRTIAYHVGASLKDAGKKCFGINLIQDEGIIRDIQQRLELETEE